MLICPASFTTSFQHVVGERMITLMTAGNLATTQSVVSILDERTKAVGDRNPSILEAPSMFQVARIVGQTLKDVIASNADTGETADASFGAQCGQDLCRPKAAPGIPMVEG